ncbi:MAG: hypothetical protein HFJ41_02430 [Clostridia bacterium]|nr:hypothetical protein [Clostridia bacterium]
MNTQMLKYLIYGVVGLLAIIITIYLILQKNNKEKKYINSLQQGTKKSKFSSEIMYQKLYLFYLKTPFIKRYILKLRRRLEIVNIDDEYLTRLQASKILTKTFLIVIPITIAIMTLTHNNVLLMSILLIFEVFLMDTIIDGMVDKIDNNLLKQQINFFSEIRHAYHEFNMVEEAIYQTAQDDDNPEMARQAEKIYEVLISDDPESELEKYYDVAPNSYLKEFAGISYLTKEFGDRKVDGASLYLKNLNNITQEMQLEILKRDKLDYVFQSLSVIAIVPMLCLEPIKNWAIGQFSFTESFYNGKNGMLVQILILLATFVCYILTRKLKDNGSTNINTKNTENPWQEKLYRIKIVKKFIDLFMPKEGTKEDRKLRTLMKDAASKDKLQWVYVNRIVLCIATFVLSVILFGRLHNIVINNVYTDPTVTYDIIGTMAEKDRRKGMEVTKSDNQYIEYFKNKSDLKVTDITKIMTQGKINKDYVDSTDGDRKVAAERIMKKISTINSEYIAWTEILGAMVLAMIAYMSPIWMLKFQTKMRQLEMEDEVMQFQTIILMLMRIERVNVEIILEWLERYANIFKDPLSKCINNYEAGPWEALEAMKEDVTYQDFIRIIESMQAAVEKIPIKDAFDELDTERDYYQAKRKESNERLISKKGMIGKVIGFAPMVLLFVGYLIIPLVFIGLTSMTTSFSNMQTR